MSLLTEILPSDTEGVKWAKLWHAVTGAGQVGGAAVSTSNPVPVRDLSGLAGVVIESGVTAVVGNFIAIQIINDAVLAAYTAPDYAGDSLVGVTLPAGLVLYGSFTAFQLTSGIVAAYNAP